MAGPRILTFNFHEPYLCLMAKTGLDFTVGEYASGPHARTWQTAFRPVPSNMHRVDEESWRWDFSRGKFDLVIAHNEINAADLWSTHTPSIVVCHNRRKFVTSRIAAQGGKQLRDYNALLERLREAFYFVFISETKQQDYGLPGTVIYPGIDVGDYGGYTGEESRILRVGNMMRARDLMFDVGLQEKVCKDLPCRVAGDDPQIPEARPSKSWDDLRETYRTLRCLLHITREDWEDGYNLATLEAMATGMPVVSLANRTSPLTDGVDGYVADSAEALRGRCEELLGDLDRARELGARGRETVQKKFPIEAFASNWRQVIEERAQSSVYSAGVPAAAETAQKPKGPRKVLVEYIKSPYTTGCYFEQVLRAQYDVVSAGPRIPENVMLSWGFSPPIPEYPPHDVDLFLGADFTTMIKRLPDGFTPEVFLYVDSGVREFPDDIGQLDCIKVCYLIDTHVDLQWRIDLARHFDYTFIAQKAQVMEFKRAGVENTYWLPLGCSPELQCVGERERIYDVGYVGSLLAGDKRRSGLMQTVRERFPNSRIGKAWPGEMAEIYAQSKIVLNCSLNMDVNMRVFEAMAGGALLITDEAYGLESLFEDGKHLVVYRDDAEVPALIEKYLADDEARQRIAKAGQDLVLSSHTYAQRAETIMQAARSGRRAKRHEAVDNRFGDGGYYRLARPELVRLVPPNTQRLLDVGCGAGEFGVAVKERGVKEVVGIEVVERAWEMARQVLDDALLCNLDQDSLPFDDGYFDCIVCGDVLEHLVDPAGALRKLGRVLSPDGQIIISIPNVRYFEVVQMLAHGRWAYADAGILDRTHLRFFTRVELEALIQEAGLEAVRLEPLSMAPTELVPMGADRKLTLGKMTFHDVTDAEYEEFRTYQYLIVAERPSSDLLARAQHALDNDDYERAYALAERATQEDPAQRKSILATASAKQGLLEKAETYYREAIEHNPADMGIQGRLGLLLVAMQRPDEARIYLEKARDAAPEDYKVAAGLGLASMLVGNVEQAFGELEAALNLNFDDEAVLRHLIEVAEQLDRLPEIEERVREFADFAPGNLDMAVTYALLLRQLGRSDDARDRLETLLMLSPGHEQARTVLAEIVDEGSQ